MKLFSWRSAQMLFVTDSARFRSAPRRSLGSFSSHVRRPPIQPSPSSTTSQGSRQPSWRVASFAATSLSCAAGGTAARGRRALLGLLKQGRQAAGALLQAAGALRGRGRWWPSAACRRGSAVLLLEGPGCAAPSPCPRRLPQCARARRRRIRCAVIGEYSVRRTRRRQRAVRGRRRAERVRGAAH